ncbi:MAG: hypothetical protein ACLFUI_02140 [Halanaerobiales bacterium]
MGKKNDNEQITVGDKTFTLQHPGVRWCLDHDYNCRDRNGNIKTSEFVQGFLDNVVIEPTNFTIDDFESLDDITEFQEKVRKFL